MISAFSLTSRLAAPNSLQIKGSGCTRKCLHFRPPTVSAASCPSTAERSRVAASPPSLYEVLGVRMTATTQEIKTAYRRLARVLHPDAAGSGQGSSGAEFMRIHEAYETLFDPEKRADYDRRMCWRLMAVNGGRPASTSRGFCSRRWETDQCW